MGNEGARAAGKVMDSMKRKTSRRVKRLLVCACMAVLAGSQALGGIAVPVAQAAENASFLSPSQGEIMRNEERKLMRQREQHEAELAKAGVAFDKSEEDTRMSSQLAWRAYCLGCWDYVPSYASQVVQALEPRPERTQEEDDMLIQADVLICMKKLVQKTQDLAGAAEAQAAAARVAPDHWMMHYAAGFLAETAYREKKDAATLAQAAKAYEAADRAAGEHGTAWVGLRLLRLAKEPLWNAALKTLPRADRKALCAVIQKLEKSWHAGDYFAVSELSPFDSWRSATILY